MDSYKFHHSALARGYVRVGHEVKEPYNGKFGRGYKLYKNNPCSSRYCIMAASPPGCWHKSNGSRYTSPQNRLHPPPHERGKENNIQIREL